MDKRQRAELQKNFGRWISGLRIARGEARGHKMTQRELATLAGISRVFLARIEAGDGVSPVTAVALAEALGVDPRESLERAGFSEGYSGKRPDLPISLIHFEHLTPESKSLIQAQLEYLYDKEAPLRMKNEVASKPPAKKAAKSAKKAKKAQG